MRKTAPNVSSKVLRLEKETIRTLNSVELKNVGGGYTCPVSVSSVTKTTQDTQLPPPDDNGALH